MVLVVGPTGLPLLPPFLVGVFSSVSVSGLLPISSALGWVDLALLFVGSFL